MKLDVLTKFATLKGLLPSQGSLVHFLGLMIEAHHPSVIDVINNQILLSPVLLTTTEITWKQLLSDLMLLETQYNKIKNELDKLNAPPAGATGATNSELQTKLNSSLQRQLQLFMDKTTTVLRDMKSQQQACQQLINSLLVYFGEASSSGGAAGGGSADGEDPVKKFFSTIIEFSRLFSQAVEDNRQKKQAQEKAAQQIAAQQHAQEAAAMAQAVAAMANAKLAAGGSQAPTTTAPPAPPVPAKSNLDIFGQFHKAQKASNADLLQEFKNKLKKQQQQE